LKSSRKKKLNVILVILLAFGLIGTALGLVEQSETFGVLVFLRMLFSLTIFQAET